MRHSLLVSAAAVLIALASQTLLAEEPPGPSSLADVPMPMEQLLREVPLVDGHNDLVIHFIEPETGDILGVDAYDIRERRVGQSDLPRMREAMLGGAIFTIWTPDDNTPEPGLEVSIALMHAIAQRSPDDFAVVTNPDELLTAHQAGKIAILMGLEGGNPVEGDLGRLAWMHERGVVEMGLVWSTNGLGSAGRNSDTETGLSELGADVVREMNRLGMIIDLSHASPATVRDVTAMTTAPVIDTHAVAGPFAYDDGARPDASMLAIAATGGLVMPMFMPNGIDRDYAAWITLRNAELKASALRVLGEEQGQYPLEYSAWPDGVAQEMEAWIAANPPPHAGIEGIADVFDYVRNLVGIDHIGTGSDFDGMGLHPSGWHPAMPDVSRLPALLEELRARGWCDTDLRKLAGENFLRVWREIRAAADAQ